MSASASTQPAFRITVEWADGDIRHADAFVGAGSADSLDGGWPDPLRPPAAGAPVSASYVPGELLPTAAQSRVVDLSRDALYARFARTPLEPAVGHWYPVRLFAGLVPAHAAPGGVVRVAALDAETARLDGNHPLGDVALTIRVEPEPLPGADVARMARLDEPVAAALAGGPGMQAFRPDGPDFLRGSPFVRADEGPDAHFYDFDRFVHHMDAAGRAEVTRAYDARLVHGARVLDLMSSWVSHLPESRDDLVVEGLGMNLHELARNPRLLDARVHDLNADPVLPYPDASFDAVVCTSSVEYLTRPVAVFAQVLRVLRPGGIFMNAFTDRWFPPKVVARWTQLQPFERVAFVLHLYRCVSGFTRLGSCTVRGLPRPADDPHAAQAAMADVAYVTFGHKPG